MKANYGVAYHKGVFKVTVGVIFLQSLQVLMV
jgi:hypothetical protein